MIIRVVFTGKEVTQDFLSLCTKDYSSFQHQDPRPPPAPGGFYLQTHDFLMPLVEKKERQQQEKEDSSRRNGEATAADNTTTERPPEHVLPGGIGTYSIRHVRGADAKRSRCGLALPGAAGEGSKSEPGYYDSPRTYDAAVWSDGQWPYRSFGPRGSSVATSAATRLASTSSFCHGRLFMRFSGCYGWFIWWSRWHAGPETKLLVEAAEQCDDELFGKREGSSSRKEWAIKVDGMGSCSDQRPNTPRSKHSATEQRRRTKINDRFQILRELIPHSDQKKDKASFLLEVIEYIRFLQKKVQKYESACPEWNQNNSKLMPWINITKLPQNKSSQGLGDGSASPAYMFSEKFDETGISFAQNPAEPDESCTVSFKTIKSAKDFANVDSTASRSPSQWLRLPVRADCGASDSMLNEQGKVTIDEDTTNASTKYSQGLLNTLNQALQISGVNISQASISVEINLGKRAINRRLTAAATTSSAEVHEDPVSTNQAIEHSMKGSSSERPSQRPKRQNG
uniref:BHLH domain-containing protein n=2 Tax=Musa acuminata subsp. malaccensis TaxID=214687 RepID=A0A804I934_MUSAM